MSGLIPMNEQMCTKYLNRKKEEQRVMYEKSVERKQKTKQNFGCVNKRD